MPPSRLTSGPWELRNICWSCLLTQRRGPTLQSTPLARDTTARAAGERRWLSTALEPRKRHRSSRNNDHGGTAPGFIFAAAGSRHHSSILKFSEPYRIGFRPTVSPRSQTIASRRTAHTPSFENGEVKSKPGIGDDALPSTSDSGKFWWEEAIQRQPLSASTTSTDTLTNHFDIRKHLEEWQEGRRDGERTSVQRSLDSGLDTTSSLSRKVTNDTLDNEADPSDDEDSLVVNYTEDGFPNIDELRQYFRRGDLVEILVGGAGNAPELAIFIRELQSEFQFYTVRGKWVHTRPRNVRFTVRNFLTPTRIDPLLPHLPTEELSREVEDKMNLDDVSVPREVGSPIIREMLDFLHASDQSYRRYSTAIDNAHAKTASTTGYRYLTLDQIAGEILPPEAFSKDVSQPSLYAIHRALTTDESGFELDWENHRLSGSFEVKMPSHMNVHNEVRDWVRSYQEHLVASSRAEQHESKPRDPPKPALRIQEFIDTARELIGTSRLSRMTTASGTLGPFRSFGPNASTPNGVPAKDEKPERLLFNPLSTSFSTSDLKIVAFLKEWASGQSFHKTTSFNFVGSMVLRWTGMYENQELKRSTGHMFLQEIGVYAPWEDRTMHNRRLVPSRLQHSVAARTSATNDDETISALTDSMKDLRKDWGDLDVYCIDAAETRDIDDGISLERTPESGSTFWVHVHVANPSAFLKHDIGAGFWAERIAQTIYLPDRIIGLLSPKLTSLFSLAPNRPALTFSAKLSDDGDILETSVTPGVIRKVHFLTPEKFRRTFDSTEEEDDKVWAVGGRLPDTRRTELQDANDLSNAQLDDLKTLASLAVKRRNRRAANAPLLSRLPSPKVTVHKELSEDGDGPTSPAKNSPMINAANYGFYTGDPAIQLESPPFSSWQRADSSATVAELMILAGHVAAGWCHERNIPVHFEGTLPNPEKQDPDDFLRKRTPASQETPTAMSLLDTKDYLKLLGGAIGSSKAIRHQAIGLDMYTKVTSPLRRFGDLLGHWQIEAALRKDENLPFPRGRVEELIQKLRVQRRRIDKAQRISDRFWALQLLLRAWQFGELDLPSTFEFYVLNVSVKNSKYNGTLSSLSLEAELSEAEGTSLPDARPGDLFEVTLDEVDCYTRKIHVRPIRLIKAADG